MRIGTKLALLLLGCAAAPAYAQSTSNMCDTSNLDRARNVFTIVNPTNADNQQCFIHVVGKGEAAGPGQLAEGNYRITLSGGGGGGGGGIDGKAAGAPGKPGGMGTVTSNLTP